MYTIKVLSKEEYAILLQQHKVVYNSAEFCELNKKKVDEIVYIGIFKDNKECCKNTVFSTVCLSRDDKEENGY